MPYDADAPVRSARGGVVRYDALHVLASNNEGAQWFRNAGRERVGFKPFSPVRRAKPYLPREKMQRLNANFFGTIWRW